MRLLDTKNIREWRKQVAKIAKISRPWINISSQYMFRNSLAAPAWTGWEGPPGVWIWQAGISWRRLCQWTGRRGCRWSGPRTWHWTGGNPAAAWSSPSWKHLYPERIYNFFYVSGKSNIRFFNPCFFLFGWDIGHMTTKSIWNQNEFQDNCGTSVSG